MVALHTYTEPGNLNDDPFSDRPTAPLIEAGTTASFYAGAGSGGNVLVSAGYRVYDEDGNPANGTEGIAYEVLENGPYGTTGNSGATSGLGGWRVTLRNTGTVDFRVHVTGVYGYVS